MKLYNTLTRTLQNFRPVSNDLVKIYTCGPTVYGYQHIGNYAAYIYWDLLIRTLKANGYKVRRVLNLTDVGHLASDADDGEDKLEKGARRENKTVFDIADFYAKDFLHNFRALNLTEPDKIARATDYIDADIKIIEQMTKNGFTYETPDGIYFDTTKLPTYAEFAHLDLENLKAGARVTLSSYKKNPTDFAVWKFIQPGENHAMRWDYLGRPGYPGWHLECSAIIHEELGEPIDIHTGGIDHIPVHHTNEIAQTFAATGLRLANFWLHCNFLNIDGQKISKSLNNTYSLTDLEDKGFSIFDFKLWVLQGHYQGDRNFTFDSLAAAKTRRLNWRNKIALTYQTSSSTDLDILPFLNNNLNSAAACAAIDTAPHLSLKTWEHIDQFFGLSLIKTSPNLSNDLKNLIQEREQARSLSDWKTADRIRETLEKQGITIKDTPSGPIWQYIV